MNAAETIAAAIKALETLRDDAALGPWKAFNDEGLLALVAGDGYSIAIDFDQENLELIIGLHRTIDAQLAILRDYEDRYLALDLARAILGVSS